MPDHEDNNKPDVPYPFLKSGDLHTPFMIFVRSYHSLSDEDFMRLFGLNGYQKMSPPLPFLGRHVVFANDAEWVHIADDYGYTLWHMRQTAEVVEKLSRKYDIFQCSTGDIDESFEFAYYRHGNLVRKYAFDHHPFRNTRMVTADIGAPLPGEAATLNDQKVAAQKLFPTITRALGIVRVAEPLECRYYGKNSD